MPRDPDREIDNTSLKVMTYDGVHRDYAAHFFRWGHISSRLIFKGCRVLDIGCGVQAPLARMIHGTEESKGMIPQLYLGVEYNKLKPPFNSPWAKFMGSFDFSKRWPELHKYGQFDVITCLEVVEHMRPAAVRKLLEGALALCAPSGCLALSTPVANGRPAKNHINEMTVATLQGYLEDAGWKVDRRFGTFASYNDIKKAASPEHFAVFQEIRRYYSGAVAACFLAPLYPDASRNNVWLCSPQGVEGLL